MRRRHNAGSDATQDGEKPLASIGHASPAGFPVVAIGASAGGLDAFRKLLDVMPPDSGMALILIQHLDPTHHSLMVDLLAGHTRMKVQHAADGMPVDPNCVYVIPPGAYLSVRDRALWLSKPRDRHGARMPFDFLLRSLAKDIGTNTVCVVLSGTGADGSLGLKFVKEAHGLVIAQDPSEAAYNGMPQAAILTGAVDFVLPLAKIPDVIVKYHRSMAPVRTQEGTSASNSPSPWLREIIDLLRSRTSHDFTLYKMGTLQRRIERRMAMAAIALGNPAQYLDVLRSDPSELDLLAKDLLINVTSFFRDPKVFDFLAKSIVPNLILSHSSDSPIRIWVVGCSTGEESYSLAMLFHEQAVAAGRDVRLQIFASDVDPDAITAARGGVYSNVIEASVSPERLARFFSKAHQGYKIIPELREEVIFTVQDVLTDPPFSSLDLISCRNVLIYLTPEAQAKVTSMLHFALREGGILLLGNSEPVDNSDTRFEELSKADRVYRHIRRSRPGELGYLTREGGAGRAFARPEHGQEQRASRQAALAELCHRLVIETHAPAAVLINHKHECLYALGPTDHFLRVVAGPPTHDILALAREGVRVKLRAALRRADKAKARVVAGGCRTNLNGKALTFSIDIRPVMNEGEELLLICFVEEPEHEPTGSRPGKPENPDLERELEATRQELESAIIDLDRSANMQKVIAEEAVSINEEFQAANEELLASKEELQSLNEELSALNSQLQETLERQRTTSNDLQNILYSSDVSTLFLDTELRIRFFTPSIESLFHVIPSDIGRPLADLSALKSDNNLLADGQVVLDTFVTIEREINIGSGTWYLRRTFPYRTGERKIDGVVITYSDITARMHAAELLDTARQDAIEANREKSRFLAAASHDLRQPLQTLVLLQGVLAKIVDGAKAQTVVAQLGETISAMTGMLNALLDINQIDSGITHAETTDFPITDLLDRLKGEFTYLAQAKGLGFRVVPCSHSVHSDPKLLEQILRNLLSNALKYTKRGRVLVGCRHQNGMLRIEIWDTGIGIADDELRKIFAEYYQINNAARERALGVGLGLSIVKRLSALLGHKVHTRSRQGKGSVFAIDVMLSPSSRVPNGDPYLRGKHGRVVPTAHQIGAILVVEDDPDVRSLLDIALRSDGHHVFVAADGFAALRMLSEGSARPDLIITDYNLPGALNGLQFATEARGLLHRQLPVIILTGDVLAATSRAITRGNCIPLNKPVQLTALTRIIERLLSKPEAAGEARVLLPGGIARDRTAPIIYVIDDDSQVVEALCTAIKDGGWEVVGFSTAEAFLNAYRPGRVACLVVDAYLPGMSGLQLLQQLNNADDRLSSIMITGHGDVPTAVQAMKAGALDFIEKPIGYGQLLASIRHALDLVSDAAKQFALRKSTEQTFAKLTPRQRQILDKILAGLPNKNIAADLNISQRSVESHRAAIMKRMGAKSLPALVRLALGAIGGYADAPPDSELSPMPKQVSGTLAALFKNNR